jgi:integrase
VTHHTRKRENVYYYDATINRTRVTFSLGTRVPPAAATLARQIECAIAEGPKSELWATLHVILPRAAYEKLAEVLHLTPYPDLSEFEKLFQDHLSRRLALGEIAGSSRLLYDGAATTFFTRMAEVGVRKMDEITPKMCEEYLIWRKTSIQAKGSSARGLATESTVLAQIFALAMEEGVIKSSPLKNRYKADTPASGAEPFTPEEMQKLAATAEGPTRLAFLLLRWTGLRGGDAADLTWEAVDLTTRVLRWRTKKRGKQVTIPLAQELAEQLDVEFNRRHPEDGDPVIPHVTRMKLYRMIADLGKKAGVEGCHPHRFRDSLAVTILAGGGTIYDVAKVLGDTVDTVERCYAPFTEQLQERVRNILAGLTTQT